VTSECLTSGKDLFAWLRQARLVPEAVLDDLRRRASPAELAAVAVQARSPRDWFRSFVRKYMGKSLPAGDCVNSNPSIASSGAPKNSVRSWFAVGVEPRAPVCPALHGVRNDAGSHLIAVVSAGTIAGGPRLHHFTHVKACEGPACTLLFLDRTRGHATMVQHGGLRQSCKAGRVSKTCPHGPKVKTLEMLRNQQRGQL
jgi:predicted RNA-binding Zn ribbon-like protein